MKKITVVLFAAVMVGCAAAPLVPGSERIRLTNSEPGKECKFLGDVTGNQGNFFTGGWTSNENMETGARNDLKNKAAAMGGNVVAILTQRAGQTGSFNQYGGSIQQTNVTVSGNVYRCPEVGSPQSANTGNTVQASSVTAQAIPTTATTMSGKDGSFRMTLPAGWIQATPPSPSYQLFAKNPVIDAGLLMSSVNSADVQDWQTYAESLKAKLIGNLHDSTSSEIRKIKVNGFDALQADFSGTLKSGVKIHYLGTFIKTDMKFVQLLTWCFESTFAANRSQFESLPSGLQI